ncbi:ribosomal protein L35 [Hamiltosporidium tvaerminnensis]|uniref:Ribosomal protein L35 n=2 Tax=Hamiltosporidium TaxID=1176354 RepID=A0A4Q9LJ13_9MICR|nr:60S ribosomal protein L35, L29 [Hamiltosporidium tvaerminnensis]TBT98831.1 ribosomal protein L35 [Hamiltosporidium magnivora]TBU03792.1 ribosomal protein L35 [Hamiltosporidium tvaerminnensis]TBU07826.1 ribosomal protein L35 [Hamiltosporidium magnivora]TBU13495.1 ribosomal protein L35 [Hamiltosporidium tvaerminnensis]
MKIERDFFKVQSKEDLSKTILDLRSVLLSLRQKKASGNIEPNEMFEARKNLARAIGVLREKELLEEIDKYKDAAKLPKHLMPKLTKAKRLALTPKQLSMKVHRVRKTRKLFPKVYFSYAE